MSYGIQEAILELKKLNISTPIKIKLPNDDLLNEYEVLIGFNLPQDYRLLLKEASDVFVGTLSPLVVTEKRNNPGELCIALREARETGLPRDWLPICEDNGDYYCMNDSGSVRFWSHGSFNDEHWPNLATWIKEVWIGGN